MSIQTDWDGAIPTKISSNTPYSDPVFKKISLKNGEINRLNYNELCKQAKALHICVKGSSNILRKRLKSHYRKLYLNEAHVSTLKDFYPYYIVIDFEATCEEKTSTKAGFQHEVIEFPAVLVNSETLKIEDIFHEYVKPGVNKKLSEYCKILTGITQEQIDAASPFPAVLHRFEEWLSHHNLIGQSAIVTDGPWDMARFLYTQSKLSRLKYPKYAKRWINIKKIFANFYNQRKPNLDTMLNMLNLDFEGRRHSGIDDAKNITRVLIQMLKDGACVRVNERIDLSYFQSSCIPAVCDIVKLVVRDDFCKSNERSSKMKESEPLKNVTNGLCDAKNVTNKEDERKDSGSNTSDSLDESTVEELLALNIS